MDNNDDSERCERFDADNDFEGGQWIGGEFFFTGRKQKRQQTEDERLYGIFAGDSDSDDERRSRKREKADYSAPVNFISKGEFVQKEQPEEERASFAVHASQSAGSTGGGLGFKSAGQQKDAEDHDEDDEAVLPSAFGQRVKAAAAERRRAERTEVKREKQREAVRAADPGFASFENHTKGIGLKLLQKMGYKPGEGLGKDRQGLAKPIEAKLRPKGQALGFGRSHDDREEKHEARARKESPQPEPGGPQRLWKKRNKEARMQREYKTAEDVLEAAASAPLAAMPILDMRGPQARLVTNLEHLNQETETAAGDKTPMPELQHNLKLLVDLAAADIQKLDARLQHEQDTSTILAKEKTRLEEEVALQASALQRATQILSDVAKCRAHDATASLSDLEAAYARIQAEYREEYILYNIGALALSQALPRFQAMLRGWSPLKQPSQFTAELHAWRRLLESDARAGGALQDHDLVSASDPYTILFAEAVLPALRDAILNAWEPRDPEPLLACMEAWDALLPRAARAHVLDFLVLPKLRVAVESWEPRAETVPIHSWLHPWLPYLGSALEQLYPSIRYKLTVALQAWQPWDSSALVLLKPWQRAFTQADWEALLVRCIVPKLAMGLQQLVINPHNQVMDPFNWVMAWHGALPTGQMAALLESHFFPAWGQVLHYWLSHSPKYDEVAHWFLSWKTLLPQDLLDHERVKLQLNYAVNLMNSAVEGAPLPPFEPPRPAPMPGTAPPSAAMPTSASQWAAPPAQVAAATAHLSIKDLVQQYAEEHNVGFVPKPGRVHEGLQVFAFGSVSIILDNAQSVVRAQIRDRWAPVSLERLLQEHMSRPTK